MDLVSEKEAGRLKALLQRLNPAARQLPTSFCRCAVQDLLLQKRYPGPPGPHGCVTSRHFCSHVPFPHGFRLWLLDLNRLNHFCFLVVPPVHSSPSPLVASIPPQFLPPFRLVLLIPGPVGSFARVSLTFACFASATFGSDLFNLASDQSVSPPSLPPPVVSPPSLPAHGRVFPPLSSRRSSGGFPPHWAGPKAAIRPGGAAPFWGPQLLLPWIAQACDPRTR